MYHVLQIAGLIPSAKHEMRFTDQSLLEIPADFLLNWPKQPNCDFKEVVHPKIKVVIIFSLLALFQTCITYFLLWNTKYDIVMITKYSFLGDQSLKHILNAKSELNFASNNMFVKQPANLDKKS